MTWQEKTARLLNRKGMFNVSRAVLAVIAALAIVLLILGLATDLGLFAWLLAIILAVYVIAALVMGRRGTV